jgi:hypothetical protein
VKLLLERGADAKLTLPDGRGALALAVNSSDPRVLRILLDHEVTSPLPLSSALSSRCQECFELMLPHARPRDLNAAVRGATVTGNLPVIDKLLDRGAQAPREILWAAALSPTAIPAARFVLF